MHALTASWVVHREPRETRYQPEPHAARTTGHAVTWRNARGSKRVESETGTLEVTEIRASRSHLPRAEYFVSHKPRELRSNPATAWAAVLIAYALTERSRRI